MNFQSYKLPKLKKEELPQKPKKKLRTKLIIALTLSIIVIVGLIKTEAPKQFLKKTIVETIAKDLKHDELGYTNFLLMGTGGEGHDGADLTDTLIIASVNPTTSSTLLTSIPRDLYVSHPKIISQRINSVYANQKYQSDHQEAALVLEEIIQDLTDIEIHYHIKIDFQALVEIVNQLGGVTIDNTEAIYDPEYPGPNYTFQTFSLPKGVQILDGETALKFARSRKSTSDFDRSRRQQQLIYAIKDEAIKQNITSNPSKISSLYSIMSRHVETDLELSEILTLAKLASNFPVEGLVNLPIHDDPNQMGGFLYNPPRSEFNNSYVLLPADSTNSQIHTYFKLFRQYPYAMHANVEINLFNGTEINGFAGSVKQNLKRFGFTINQTSNADNNEYSLSQINLIGQNELLAQQVTEALNILLQIPEAQINYSPGEVNSEKSLELLDTNTIIDPDKVTINIVLGSDLQKITENLDVFASLYSRIEQAIRENRAAQQENEILNTEDEDSDENSLLDDLSDENTEDEDDQNNQTEEQEPTNEETSENEKNQTQDNI